MTGSKVEPTQVQMADGEVIVRNVRSGYVRCSEE